MIMPFEGTYPITRPFIKFDPSMPKALWDPLYGPTHRGVDWALPVGVSLRATMNGQVTAAGFSPDGSGIIVVIRSGNLYVKYFHMSVVAVNVGQSVKTGDFLGKSGSTGNATGPHLHFQVEQPFGNAVDPMPLIEKPKEDDMKIPDKNTAKTIKSLLLFREVKDSEVGEDIGKDSLDFVKGVERSSEYLTNNHIIKKAYPDAVKRIAELEAKLSQPDNERLKKAKEKAQEIIES